MLATGAAAWTACHAAAMAAWAAASPAVGLEADWPSCCGPPLPHLQRPPRCRGRTATWTARRQRRERRATSSAPSRCRCVCGLWGNCLQWLLGSALGGTHLQPGNDIGCSCCSVSLPGAASCPAGAQLLSKRRCPTALQIMRDPVMLATGQT